MKAVAALIASLVVLVYPFLIYTSVQNVSPAIFGLGLFFICAIKLYLSREKVVSAQNSLLLAMLVLCAVAAVANSILLLRLYPVGMSFGIGLIFLLSLRDPESFIERMAKLAGKTITPRAKRYTRKLTAVWAGVLILNSAIALYLALFSSLKHWALYCGLIAYLIFGFIFAVEFVYRQYYIKKYGA